FRKFKYLLSVNPLRARADLRWMRAVPVTRHYFMFSYSHVGGAERVHAAIVRLIDAARPLVLFTGLHDKGGLESEFGDPSRVRNVSAGLYHPFFARRARALLMQRIGDADRPVLFGSNS